NAALASAKVFHGDLTVLLPLEKRDRQLVLKTMNATQMNNCPYDFFILPALGFEKSRSNWRESNCGPSRQLRGRPNGTGQHNTAAAEHQTLPVGVPWNNEKIFSVSRFRRRLIR